MQKYPSLKQIYLVAYSSMWVSGMGFEDTLIPPFVNTTFMLHHGDQMSNMKPNYNVLDCIIKALSI